MTQSKSKKEEFIKAVAERGEMIAGAEFTERYDWDKIWDYITDNFVSKEEVKEIVEEAYYLGLDHVENKLSDSEYMAQFPKGKMFEKLMDKVKGEEQVLQELLSKHNITD